MGQESATAKGGTALASVSVPGQKGGAIVQDGWISEPEAFTEIVTQLRSYFEERLTRFFVRPCHRVIGAGGRLAGCAGGPERKQQLLGLENVHQAA